MTQINDYCTHDVLDTYFVFLRTRVLLGVELEKRQDIVKQTKQYLAEHQEERPAYKTYLKGVGRLESVAVSLRSEVR